MQYTNLWRILYAPKSVFDELREDQHTGLPGLITIGVLAISTFVIAILTTPSYEEVEEYRKQSVLLMEELDRDSEETRRAELYEEVYGPQDLPQNARVGATLTDVPASILGYLLTLVFLASSFWIVGKSFKSEILWRRWFGFAAWVALPGVLVVVLDVILAATDRNRILFSFDVGGIHVYGTTLFIWHAWSFIIAVGGLKSWTSKGWGSCVGLAFFAHLILVIPVFILISIGAAVVSLFT